MSPYDLLTAGNVVLDIGANDGSTALQYVRAVGPDGWVVAVEPNPVAMARLRERCAAHANIHPMALAVGRTAGETVLYEDAGDTKRGSLWAANVLKPSDSTHPVTVTTLDALVTAMALPPTLIKLDTQGAEADILAGGTQTLDLRPMWFVEIWRTGLDTAGATVWDVLLPFKARGYTAHLKHGEAMDWDALHGIADGCKGHGAIDVLFLPLGA